MNDSQLVLKSGIVDYDDDIAFQIEAHNQSCAISLKFYGSLGEFFDFGTALTNFPKNLEHQIDYPPEGAYKEGISYAYYLKIRVFCYERNGSTAIEITVSNNEPEPYGYEARLYILTDAASLNRLGQKLASWDMKYISQMALYDE